jgi:hypothetical protein
VERYTTSTNGLAMRAVTHTLKRSDTGITNAVTRARSRETSILKASPTVAVQVAMARNSEGRWRVYGPTEFECHILSDNCSERTWFGRFCQKGRKIFDQMMAKVRRA